MPLPADFKVAPFVNFTDWPSPDIKTAMSQTGIKSYNLGFISSQGPCSAAWGGYPSLSPDATGDQIDYLNGQIAYVQANGGKVAASFGGVANKELAEVCTDVPSLKAAYKKVIDRYNLDRVDFDIESGAQNDRAASTRRGQAIAQLQQEAAAAGKTLTVTFTLPVMPYGLTTSALTVTQDTANAGARIDLINVMAMDYGTGTTNMGQAAIDAATNTAKQIGFLYPGTTDAQRISRVGITPMIGVNDTQPENFGLANAQQVTAWAKANNVGMIAWWALVRDQPCATNAVQLSEHCSGTPNAKWAYANAFSQR